MNNFLLKDHRWIEALLESCSETFVRKLESKTGNGTEPIADLDEELYLWSFYCKTESSEKFCDGKAFFRME